MLISKMLGIPTQTTQIADTDQIRVRSETGEHVLQQSLFRKLFSLDGSSWDVTGVPSPAYPLEFSGASATRVGVTNDYNLTPLPSGSPIKIGMSGTVALGTGTAWAEVTIPTLDPGDTVQGGGFVLSNAQATLDDLRASFASFPTLIGTVDWLAYCAFSGPSSVAYYVTKAAGIVGFIPITTVAPGDVMYFGVDFDAGTLVRQINAGAVQSLSVPLTALRVSAAIQSTPEPPVFAAGSLLFSLGSSDGGRSPFVAVGDAAPPPGAADGKRYPVINTGTYKGKTLRDGDVAEFCNDLLGVIITPGAYVTQDSLDQQFDAILDNVDARLAETYLAANYILGCYNDRTSPTDGDMYIVGPLPSGGFAGFTPGSLVVGLNGGWVEFPTNIVGRSFSIRMQVGGQNGHVRGWITRLDQAGFLVDNYTPRFGLDDSYSYGDVGELGLLALGWVLAVRDKPALRTRRSIDATGQALLSMSETGDANVVEITVGGVSDLTVTITHLAGAYTEVVYVFINDGFGLLTVHIGGIDVLTGPGDRIPVRVFGSNSFIRAQQM